MTPDFLLRTAHPLDRTGICERKSMLVMMNTERIIKENSTVTHKHMQSKPLLTASHYYGGVQVYTILKNLKLIFPKQKKKSLEKSEHKLQNPYKLKASRYNTKLKAAITLASCKICAPHITYQHTL